MTTRRIFYLLFVLCVLAGTVVLLDLGGLLYQNLGGVSFSANGPGDPSGHSDPKNQMLIVINAGDVSLARLEIVFDGTPYAFTDVPGGYASRSCQLSKPLKGNVESTITVQYVDGTRRQQQFSHMSLLQNLARIAWVVSEDGENLCR